MEIVNALTQSASPNVGASTTKASTVSADFETFLKMLTAQIQNQDPMNPIDSSDYATQLATFSSVKQQVLANSYLENIQAHYQQVVWQASLTGLENQQKSKKNFGSTAILLILNLIFQLMRHGVNW
jgi:flagellar hook assembly protein FlgD